MKGVRARRERVLFLVAEIDRRGRELDALKCELNELIDPTELERTATTYSILNTDLCQQLLCRTLARFGQASRMQIQVETTSATAPIRITTEEFRSAFHALVTSGRFQPLRRKSYYQLVSVEAAHAARRQREEARRTLEVPVLPPLHEVRPADPEDAGRPAP